MSLLSLGRNNHRIRALFMKFKFPTWRSVCRERGSLRFHLRQHSHSVRVRWRRGAVEAEVALAAEQAARPEPQAIQAARTAVRAATVLFNLRAAKAVRPAIRLPNPPAPRAKTVSTPQGPVWGQGALERTVNPGLERCAGGKGNGEVSRFAHARSVTTSPGPLGWRAHPT